LRGVPRVQARHANRVWRRSKQRLYHAGLLRQPDEASRQREYKHFVSDLRAALRAAEE
jgi:hypothetical protein